MSDFFNKTNNELEVILHDDDGPVTIGVQGKLRNPHVTLHGSRYDLTVTVDSWIHLTHEETKDLAVKLLKVAESLEPEAI